MKFQNKAYTYEIIIFILAN